MVMERAVRGEGFGECIYHNRRAYATVCGQTAARPETWHAALTPRRHMAIDHMLAGAQGSALLRQLCLK